MSILDEIKGFFAQAPQMIDKRQPKRVKTAQNIIPQTFYRTRQDLQVWRSAIAIADSVHNPNRTELYRGYQDAVLDAHVKAVISQRMAMTLSKPFCIYDEKGEKLDDWTEKFNRPGMAQVYKYVLESVYWGHSLIQLGDIVDDTFVKPKLVPRQNVNPEKEIVKPITSGQVGIPYNKAPYKNWTLEASGDGYGLLNSIMPCWIMKKNNMNSWASYSERFGEPIVLLKLTTGDNDKREQARDELMDQGGGMVAVLDEDQEVEFVEANTGTGYNTYKDLLEESNKEISKVVLGGTMTVEDGSSRSQAEVHERVAEDKMKEDIELLESVINSELLPKMRALGIAIPEKAVFVVENKEEVSAEELFNRVIELEKVGIQIDEEYITDTFQIPIKERKEKSVGGGSVGKF